MVLICILYIYIHPIEKCEWRC